MVDTVRTLSALQTLLADNTAGDISAQDLRDFLVSAMLETTTATVTTGNVTAVAGKHYELTVSGMTADRHFILPGSAVVGSEIRVKLVTDAPADHELILIGDAGVSINGGTAATEWSRLFIDNEFVTFRATAAGNWDVVNDGRIPQAAFAYLASTAVNAAAGALWSNIPLDTVLFDVGNIFDATNDVFKIRRHSVLEVSGQVTVGSTSPQSMRVQNDTTGVRVMKSPTLTASASQEAGQGMTITQAAAGDIIGFDVFNGGAIADIVGSGTFRETWASVWEVL